MQIVGVILLLISIGTTVGPVGTVVVMYSDDLTALVIPSEVEEIFIGDSPLLADNIYESGIGDGNLGTMGFVMPKFVSATVDVTTRTFSVTVNATNILNYDLTLNALNATVVTTRGGAELASIHLSIPVTIPAGQWSMVVVSGTWGQAAEEYYINNPGATSINVTLASAGVDVNGIVVQMSEPIEIGDIPLTLEGLEALR
jgi:hypothetical protein